MGGKKSIGGEKAGIRAREIVRQSEEGDRGTVGSLREIDVEEDLSGSWA